MYVFVCVRARVHVAVSMSRAMQDVMACLPDDRPAATVSALPTLDAPTVIEYTSSLSVFLSLYHFVSIFLSFLFLISNNILSFTGAGLMTEVFCCTDAG
jgi:hypothetical protein